MEIRFESVRVSRGGAVTLEVPDLTIRGGRVTALLGPNGAGKSTLLRAVAALDRAQQGRILLDGAVVRRGRATYERVALAFQSPVFVAGTVRANLDLGLRLRKVPPLERAARIDAATASLGVSHLLDRNARRLSGGEAQRVNLARALALRAPVTLLDEPLAGLDAPSREALLRELPAILRELTTVVVVTHDREEAARLADDVAVLLDGRVGAAGPLPQVFARPPTAGSAHFLGWTLVPVDDGIIAIRPGALVPGGGDHGFTFDVDQRIEVGERWDLLGRINGVPAALVGRGLAPRGAQVAVAAASCDVVRFPLITTVKDSAETR